MTEKGLIEQVSQKGNIFLEQVQEIKGQLMGQCKRHPGVWYPVIAPEDSLEIFGKYIAVACPECDKECEKWQEEQRKKEKDSRVRNLIRHACLPPKHLEFLKEHPSVLPYCEGQAQAFSLFWKTIQRPHSGVILYGNQGTGKSLMLSWGIFRLAKEELAGFYTTALEIYQEWKRDFQHEIEFRDTLCSYDILAIDEADIFPRHRADKGIEGIWFLLNQIITRRIDNDLPVWLATNATLQELEEIYGSRSIRRILQDGITIEFNWNSYRDFNFIGREQ